LKRGVSRVSFAFGRFGIIILGVGEAGWECRTASHGQFGHGVQKVAFRAAGWVRQDGRGLRKGTRGVLHGLVEWLVGEDKA
jgi:hypothetical protein